MPRLPTVRTPVSPARRAKRFKSDPSHVGRVKPNAPRPPGETENLIERRAKALEMRKMGKTYREIAKDPFFLNADGTSASPNTIHDYVQAELMALVEQTTLDAVSVREMELERLDLLIKSMFPRAVKGDIGAGLAVLKVLESRRKLLGVDAPDKSMVLAATAHLTPDTVAKMSEDEIQQRVNNLISQFNASTVNRPAEVIDAQK